MNGSTFPTHAAGSLRKFGGVGRQMPGGTGDGYGVGVGPNLPSFMRAVSIAVAVASPIAIPAAFDPGGLSGESCYVRVIKRLQRPQLLGEKPHKHAERR